MQIRRKQRISSADRILVRRIDAICASQGTNVQVLTSDNNATDNELLWSDERTKTNVSSSSTQDVIHLVNITEIMKVLHDLTRNAGTHAYVAIQDLTVPRFRTLRWLAQRLTSSSPTLRLPRLGWGHVESALGSSEIQMTSSWQALSERYRLSVHVHQRLQDYLRAIAFLGEEGNKAVTFASDGVNCVLTLRASISTNQIGMILRHLDQKNSGISKIVVECGEANQTVIHVVMPCAQQSSSVDVVPDLVVIKFGTNTYSQAELAPLEKVGS